VTLALAQHGEVALVTIDRPEARNAFDGKLIAAMTDAFERAGRDPGTRVIVLAATGNAFSAGGDLAWMRQMAGASPEQNLEDARSLARLLAAIDRSPKATLARVQGPAFGGAIGLIAACDVALAVPAAEFAASEVRLGLVPAVISPYVVRAVGYRAARRLFLTAERISAEEARRIGLIHEVVASADLDSAVGRYVSAFLAGGAAAIATTKRLLSGVVPIHDAVIDETVRILAEVRASPEAQEGIAAFFAKRLPQWLK
jgi:methylglutaconyl-CoA hydratase